MVLTLNIVSVTVFLLIIFAVFLLRWVLVSFYKRSTKDLISVVKMLSEKEHQQQVIYNISTSIFLLRTGQEIIRSTISEIVVMYNWPNIAYFPSGQKVLMKDFYGQVPKYSASEIFQLAGSKDEVHLNNHRLGEFVSLFMIGQHKPLGVLYVGKTGLALTPDQAAFFKTVASFLTVALENIERLKV